MSPSRRDGAPFGTVELAPRRALSSFAPELLVRDQRESIEEPLPVHPSQAGWLVANFSGGRRGHRVVTLIERLRCRLTRL